jgi:hypothetical protein
MRCIQLLAGLVSTAAVGFAMGCGYETAASPPGSTQSAQLKPAAVQAADTQPPEEASRESESGAEHAALPHDAIAAPGEPRPATTAGKRPTADRAPRRPGEAEKISFEDLVIGMQADIVFRPFMLSDRAKELDGQRVSIVGYMHGGVASTERNKEFVLLRNTECKFGPGGQADHLAQVYLRAGHETGFEKAPVKVEGTLKIEPFQGVDGNTWSIYRLEDALVVK